MIVFPNANRVFPFPHEPGEPVYVAVYEDHVETMPLTRVSKTHEVVKLWRFDLPQSPDMMPHPTLLSYTVQPIGLVN